MMRKPLFLTSLALVLLSHGLAYSQTGIRKSVSVSAPTRLDWKFAVSGFGANAAKLPGDYDSKKQTYFLYVPKTYQPNRDWPLIAFISPGNGPAGWNNWKSVCEKHGVLFCSPYKAGNKVAAGQRTRIVLDMLDDVRRKYRIDPDQTYLGGFSGGGRMSCTIAYSLPELFGGVVPVCGTNPLPRLTYLKHRLQDRLSVAFVTGEKDFNRKENEKYMYPYFKELDIRTKLWVAKKVGHSIPSGMVLEEVYLWLKEDLPHRKKDRGIYPKLQVTANKTPDAEEQANLMLQTAQLELNNPMNVWRGVALAQGVMNRWPKSKSATAAKMLLQAALQDPKSIRAIEQQGGQYERRFLSAQAKALERFGLLPQARQAWQILAKTHPDSPEGKLAKEAIQRLKGNN